MTTTLIAIERFFYNGRNVEKDEQFEAEDQDVMLLTHHHTPKATTIVLEPQKKKLAEERPADETPEREARPRNYKRRDMKAEE